jgi:carboxyl-terminal processing protease
MTPSAPSLLSPRRPLARRASACLLAAACLAPVTPTPAAAQGAAPAAPPFSAELAVQTFDSVWNRIAHTHYDPDLGGVDWDAVRVELEPRARRAESNAELRTVLRDMLSRLGLSHFGIFGPETAEALEGSGGDDAGAGPGQADPGLDVRVVEGRLAVVRVRPGSPAEVAGVHPGWQLLEVNGADVSSLSAEMLATLSVGREAEAPAEDRLQALYLPALALSRMQGEPGMPVELAFLDASGAPRSLTLGRSSPPGEVVRFGFLPPSPSGSRNAPSPWPPAARPGGSTSPGGSRRCTPLWPAPWTPTGTREASCST